MLHITQHYLYNLLEAHIANLPGTLGVEVRHIQVRQPDKSADIHRFCPYIPNTNIWLDGFTTRRQR